MSRCSKELLILTGIVLALAGCGTTTVIIADPGASPSATVAATTPAQSTPVSNPPATNTPTPHAGNPTPTNTPPPVTSGDNCGSITTSSTKTTPSNPQPLEDCFTNAFQHCSEASIIVTFIDANGTTEDAMHTGPGCTGAVIHQHKHTVSGGTPTDTNAVITCTALVPSGSKYSLRECSDNEWIFFP